MVNLKRKVIIILEDTKQIFSTIKKAFFLEKAKKEVFFFWQFSSNIWYLMI